MPRKPGFKDSEETRRKKSRAMKRAWASGRLVRKRSAKTRARIAKTVRRLYASGNFHPRIGRKHSDETKKHWSDMKRGKKLTTECRRKMSVSQKKRWAAQEVRAAASESKKKWFGKGGGGELLRARACRVKYLNNPIPQEESVKAQLRTLKIEYEGQKIFLGKFVVDIYLPVFNCVIECDGKCHKKSADAARDAELAARLGLKVIRIPYVEINQNPKRAVKEALKCLQ